MPWLYVAEKDYPGSYSAFWCERTSTFGPLGVTRRRASARKGTLRAPTGLQPGESLPSGWNRLSRCRSPP